MSISLSSARRVAVGAVGASAVAGAMLFGAIPMAQAASAPASAPTDSGHVTLAGIHHHDPHLRHDLHHSVNIL